ALAIGARAERRAAAAEHRDARAEVARERAEEGRELLEGGGVERVAALGTVQPDARDRAVALDLEGAEGGHARSSSASHARMAARSASSAGAGGRVGGSANAVDLIGLPATGKGPSSGSSTSTIMLRARTCGCAITSATSWIGPHGMPAAAR